MDYEVVGLLGRGAMAVVDLAVTPDGTQVARKRLPLAGSAFEIDVARRRLRRESEILRSLHHPAIVEVLEVEDDGTDVVIVMPALDCSLADRVATHGPLSPGELVRVGRTLLEGLAAAHRGGVVHRDIKPGNVLFDVAGRPALADFGVAVSRELTAGLTATGTVVGTAAWMAPEQARGETAGPASDVFALGATLLFAATGQGPWGAGPAEVVLARAARGEVADLLDSVPTVLRSPLAAMLAILPEDRPSAAAVLGGFEGTALAPVATGGRRRRRSRVVGKVRRWGTMAAIGGTVVLLGTVVALLVTGGASRVQSGHRAAVGPVTPPGSACHPAAYQACGAAPSPHTDGVSCLPGWYDLNGVPSDGCEARSDYTPGAALVAGAPVRANLVPVGAVDTFTTHVSGHVLSFCSDALVVQMTSPAKVADLLQVWHGTTLVASTTSVDGQTATATVAKPGCFGSHSETLTLRVSAVVGASAGDFTLTRTGGW